MNDRCCYSCQSKEELRPYGPNGSLVCFKCAMSPERIEETEKQFAQQFLEAEEQGTSPIVIIGEETGPRPAHPRN